MSDSKEILICPACGESMEKIYMDEDMVKNDKFDVIKDMIQEYIRVISKS